MAHKSAGMEGHATGGAQVCHEGWPDGTVVMHNGAGMEGHATGGTQVCREGWPDGAVLVHKGAGMEGQMVGGWIKRFPAALMGARRATRYTDRDKPTQARPRLHARRRGAERVSRAQENIVTYEGLDCAVTEASGRAQ
ncbi:MAG: hypothetical protein NTY19_03090 [Planctomycetota bacterium]|nr:hypothetical protein [Planctomycetota bacterium]